MSTEYCAISRLPIEYRDLIYTVFYTVRRWSVFEEKDYIVTPILAPYDEFGFSKTDGKYKNKFALTHVNKLIELGCITGSESGHATERKPYRSLKQFVKDARDNKLFYGTNHLSLSEDQRKKDNRELILIDHIRWDVINGLSKLKILENLYISNGDGLFHTLDLRCKGMKQMRAYYLEHSKHYPDKDSLNEDKFYWHSINDSNDYFSSAWFVHNEDAELSLSDPIYQLLHGLTVAGAVALDPRTNRPMSGLWNHSDSYIQLYCDIMQLFQNLMRCDFAKDDMVSDDSTEDIDD